MVVKLSVEDDSLEKVYHNMMLSGECFLTEVEEEETKCQNLVRDFIQNFPQKERFTVLSKG